MINCRKDIDFILSTTDIVRIKLGFFEEKKVVNFCDVPTYDVCQVDNLAKLDTYIVLDTETTGFSGKTGKIVQLTAIKYKNFEPIEIFTTLINPLKKIPLGVSKIHGIYDEDVEYSPKFFEIIDHFCEFIKDSVIVGHNLSFDINFLAYEGVDFSKLNCRKIDTLYLARKYLKDSKDHKLITLCQYYQLDYFNYHNATEDVLATGQIFANIVNNHLKQKV